MISQSQGCVHENMKMGMVFIFINSAPHRLHHCKKTCATEIKFELKRLGMFSWQSHFTDVHAGCFEIASCNK